MDYIIGVDFDNTLVYYEDVMYSVALQYGLIRSGMRKSKKDIREKIRQLPNGEMEWQRLQAIVYGPRMGEAKLIDGVRMFFELCKQHRVVVYIISHKTEYASFDRARTNLWVASMIWMRENGFFETDGMGMSLQDVYFESTRREKIDRIRQLGCTHFIDDLEEIFLEDSFPRDVEKILYAPNMQLSSLGGVRVFTTWTEINDYFFGTTG